MSLHNIQNCICEADAKSSSFNAASETGLDADETKLTEIWSESNVLLVWQAKLEETEPEVNS
jgi:hypothetical protein